MKKKLAVLCTAAIMAWNASPAALGEVTSDRDFGTLLTAEKGVVVPATLVCEVGSDADLAAAKRNGANVVLFRVDEALKAVDGRGTPFGELSELVAGLGTRFVPGYYVESEAAADAVVAFVLENGYQDFYFASDDEKLVLRARRAVPVSRGILDLRGAEELTPAQAAGAANRSFCKIVLMDAERLTPDYVERIRMKTISVWGCESDPSADRTEVVRLLLTGVNGYVGPGFAAAADAMETVFSAEHSILRRSFVAAHRGCGATDALTSLEHVRAIENTLDSMKLAFECGADYVEIDIHQTRDGELVVLHDEELSIVTNASGKVDDKTLAELREITFKHSEGTEFADVRIPTLREVFETFRGNGKMFLIEVKDYDEEIVTALAALIREYGVEEQCNVIGFSLSTANYLNVACPELPMGALGGDPRVFHLSPEGYHTTVNVKETLSNLYMTVGPYNTIPDPAYPYMEENVVREAALRGLQIWLWTFPNLGSADSWMLKGVTGLTTDAIVLYPKIVREIAAPDSLTLEAGETIAPVVEGVSYDGTRTQLPDAEPILVDGDSVGVSDGKLEALRSGTSTVVYRVRMFAQNNQTYHLYSQPVTVRVDGEGETGCHCGSEDAGTAALLSGLLVLSALPVRFKR